MDPSFVYTVPAESCKFLNGKVRCARFCTRFSLFFFFHLSIFWSAPCKKICPNPCSLEAQSFESFFMLFTQQLIRLSNLFRFVLFLDLLKNSQNELLIKVGLICTATA